MYGPSQEACGAEWTRDPIGSSLCSKPAALGSSPKDGEACAGFVLMGAPDGGDLSVWYPATVECVHCEGHVPPVPGTPDAPCRGYDSGGTAIDGVFDCLP